MDSGYLVSLVIFIAIYGLFSLGLNLQWGFTGLINFGHVAFMTVGAYTTVLLSLQGLPLILATLVGAALAAVLGLLIGFSTLRLREDYLAIVTIGVSELVRLIALNEEWLTRGSFGLQRYALPLEDFRPTVFSRFVMIGILTAIVVFAYSRLWHWLKPRLQAARAAQRNLALGGGLVLALLGLWLYLVCATALSNYSQNPARNGLMFLSLLVLALVFWRLEELVRSPWGRVLKAIREDEAVARALGKNVFWYKLQAFMLGGAISGISGAFYAWQLSTVYPDSFAPQRTFDAWTIIVLGGAGNNWGALLGSAIFWAYTAITRDLNQVIPLDDARVGALRIMLIGLLLMVLMIWRPQGILGKKEELTLGR